MVLPGSHGVPRAPRYSGATSSCQWVRVRGSHPLWQSFPASFPCLQHNSGVVLQPRMELSTRFGLFPLRSPLLGESRLISFPSGTEMFHFPEFASPPLCIQSGMPGHCSRRVAPFRNPRIKGCLAPPRGFSQLTTSFIACRRQGIHPMLLSTCFSKQLSFIPCSIVNFIRFRGFRTLPDSRHLTAFRQFPLVELAGFEPATPGLQSRCSPS